MDSVVVIHWHKDSIESEFRSKRRIENRVTDTCLEIYLEGFLAINMDSMAQSLREGVDDMKNNPIQAHMMITYLIQYHKIKVIVDGNGGDFWFIVKKHGSDIPYKVYNQYAIPGRFEFYYDFDITKNESEFIAFVQGIRETDNCKRLLMPKHRKH